ncbi:MAG: hypothetical protein U9R75_00715, partial [Candidatus Thermoplasmatota archaeon]|nr:hypothetical protein [Candidatus Thermoplasmatota archaeon]
MRGKNIAFAAVLIMAVSALMPVMEIVNGQIRRSDTSDEEHYDLELVREMGLELMVRDISDLDLIHLMESEGVTEGPGAPTPVINGMGTGLTPPSYEGWQAVQHETKLIETISSSAPMATNTSKDHSASIHFPPIGNQGGEGSCVSWSIGYYTKTFQEASEHNWNLSGAGYTGPWPGYPTVSYQNRIMSPDFLYHQVNIGQKLAGSYYHDNINVCKRTGISTWQKMPYKDTDSTTWPSEAAWREAPLYRTKDTTYFMYVNTDSTINSLKTWIDNGNLATISIDAGKYSSLSGTTGGDLWTNATNCVQNRNHANTIVGYDDNFGPYSEDSTTRKGAFKVANSWGKGFGGDSDSDGCYWISYRAMRDKVDHVYMMTDRINYDPELIGVFEVSHAYRNDCEITLGVGNTSSPTATKRFDDYWYDGGPFAYPGNLMVQDMTDFSSSLTEYYQKNYFIGVKDAGSTTTGTIKQFTVEYYDDFINGSKLLSATSTDPIVLTVQGSTVYAEVILRDTEYPILLSDSTPSVATTGDPLNFSAKITDNREIFGVWIEYWTGTGSRTNISCSKTSEDIYYLNTTAPHTLDTFHYIFHFNDTTGYWNQTTEKTISIADNDVPLIDSAGIPASATTGDDLNITAIVTDNIAVNDVELEYWYLGLVHTNVTMVNSGGNNYSYTLSMPSDGGVLNLKFKARDTSMNINSTRNFTYFIIDNDLPVFEMDNTPSIGTTGEELTFSVNVTDNVLPDAAFVEYWYDRGMPTNSSMVMTGPGVFEHNITLTHTLSNLTYIFHANDTSNNWNMTGSVNISVIDNDAPTLGIDGSDTAAYTGDEFVFKIRTIDNIGLENVKVDYRINDEAHLIVNCTYQGDDNWTVVVVLPMDSIGELEYSFIAEDTSGNQNTTIAANRTIFDNDEPLMIEDLSDTEALTGEQYDLLVNATDNIGVAEVIVEYWFQDQTHENISLISLGDELWSGNISIPLNSTDPIHYIVWIFDAASLFNWTNEQVIMVSDNILPTLVEYPSGLAPTTGDQLTISIQAKDNIAVSNVTMTYRFGEGMNETAEMSLLENDTYRTAISIPHSLYDLEIMFIVVDTSNNSFVSDWGVFEVLDNDVPALQSYMDVEIELGTTFTANATGCSDNIGIHRYLWTIQGPVTILNNNSVLIVNLTETGSYTVNLNVTDAQGNYNTTVFKVNVKEPTIPVLEFKVELLDGNVTREESLLLRVLLSNNGDVNVTLIFELRSDMEIVLDDFVPSDAVLPAGFLFNDTIEVPASLFPEGEHHITMIATADNGNISLNETVSFIIWDDSTTGDDDDDVVADDDDDTSDDGNNTADDDDIVDDDDTKDGTSTI